MDFKQYLSLVIKDVNSTIETAKYEGGYLTVDFSYSSGVEGKEANLNLSFDPEYFDVSPTNMAFPIKSEGMSLSYLTKYSLYSVLEIVFAVIGAVAIAIFAVSLPFHKMIGV